MKIIQLADGTELQVITVHGHKETINNAYRDVLEFHFTPEGNSVDELAKTFSDEAKTRDIKIIDIFEEEDILNQEFIHSDYVIRANAALKNVLVQPETSNSPALEATHIVISMAQQTYMEKTVSLQGQDLERLRVESAEANTELFEMMVMMGVGF